MTCDDKDCLLRHERQDKLEKQIAEIYEVICGGVHPENSLSTKVNEMWRENQGIKNFIKGTLVSFLILIFWCGYQFALLNGCIKKIEQLEARFESISK